MAPSPAPLPRIAIALGDPAGIGPEIALKAARDLRVTALCHPVLVGDRAALEWHARACGLDAGLPRLRDLARAGAPGGPAFLALDQFAEGEFAPGEIRASHGRAAVEAARLAIAAAMAGELDAVVACPQTEMAIHQAGIPFDGYPSFVARCTGTPAEDSYLMLCFDGARIVHATLHVSLAQAIALVTRERVRRVIQATHDTVRRLTGIEAPRIAVSGLNPHAGEGGLFGHEEAEIISPAIAESCAAGIRAEGPFGADTMFHKTGYDAFIVMFHDQGHIAAKLLATNRTAGMTIGTPILFSSVAHGSALDIAGQNKASAEAVVEAVGRLARAATQGRAATERAA